MRPSWLPWREIFSWKAKSPCWRPWNGLRPWFRAQRDREMHRGRADSSVIRFMNFLTMSGALGLSLRLNLGVLLCGLVEQEFGGLGGYFSHLGDDGALASVVVNPFLVELGLGLGEPPVDGLSVDLGGPLPVRAMQLGRVAVAVAVRFAAAVVSLSQASGSDVADVGELGGEVPVSALVAG